MSDARSWSRHGDERCPREAGLDVVATLGDQLVEPVSRDLLIFGIEQPENDGQRVRCLSIAVDVPSGLT